MKGIKNRTPKLYMFFLSVSLFYFLTYTNIVLSNPFTVLRVIFTDYLHGTKNTAVTHNTQAT